MTTDQPTESPGAPNSSPHSPTTENKSKPFAYQVAAVAIWAPIIAIFLSIAAQSTFRNQTPIPAVTITMAIVNISLILTGFVCSLIALLAIPRRGKKDLLGRGIVGLALNGIFILGAVYVLFFFNPFASAYPKYYGTWQLDSQTPGITEQIELHEDKQFRLTLTGKTSADFSGDWRLQIDRETRGAFLVLHITHLTAGTPDLNGKQLALRLKELNGDTLIITTDKGEETWHRLPPQR